MMDFSQICLPRMSCKTVRRRGNKSFFVFPEEDKIFVRTKKEGGEREREREEL